MRHVIAVMVLLSSATAEAAFYKCVVGGKTVFSDQPCAADAEKLEVRVIQPSEEEQKRAEERLKKWGKDLSISELKRRRAALVQSILDDEARINNLNASMERDLALLRAKKLRANNNLAGATWENSISKEMDAVTKKYQLQIDRIQRNIDRTRNVIEQLDRRIERESGF